MTLRSPLLARCCLIARSALVSKCQLGQSTRGVAPSGNRSLATHTESPIVRQHCAEVQPPSERTALDILLRAIQKKDSSQICSAFIKWTTLLADQASPLHLGAVEELLQLSTPTLSEILRCLDPFNCSGDAAEGLRVSAGEAQYTATGNFFDPYGVRNRHRQVLAGLQTLFRIRTSLTLPDYEIAMRTAGAAVDFHAAREFWGNMAENGLQQWRTTRAWNEFLKAFFMTEPLYYQFDRARVAVTARDLFRSRNPVHGATLEALDRQRFSVNALQHEPWNRILTDIDKDVMRDMRKRVQDRGYREHWRRGLLYGVGMNEELLCTSIKAFARSASLHAIKELIFGHYYGILIENDRDPAQTTITGGHDFPHDSPLRPTAALLEAIAEGLGAMSHIALALQLINFVSNRYSIAIPHSVWSSLLNWAYIFSSKPFGDARQKLGDWPATTQRPVDVIHIWEAMTSPSHGNITPTFEDYDVYIKTLLVQRCVVKAFSTINEYALPYYTTLVQEYETAFADEVLQADALRAAAPARATLRRQKAETRKDHAHHRISLWFKQLLKVISANRHYRDGPAGQEMVPNLVRDYGYFLPAFVKYRTAQGTVTLERNGDESLTERVSWERRWRTTLPMKRSGVHMRVRPGSTEPEFDWPAVWPMRVLETRPVPRERLARVPPPPPGRKEGKWWERLEEQLIM
ncbi:uncharacterized protein BBA_03858 [Beauveria bassiana ARSEF 2860]|uniref:Mitochondrial ATPase expression-domain-containing protein n=1 Tax=Beauveria bassiana (strain ARSEF 2860) TaxID=655819 RepID=J4KPD9_BEAB2|nr:uncharacterized protein BBA_03858 [Beauveria bassiana ARSEF 2860]EJP67284.1 hypothetical protein BBA_03858 [Beauveria bassiana ARSEF 2860]